VLDRAEQKRATKIACYCRELIFQWHQRERRSFLQKNNGWCSELSPFTSTAIRYFGVSDGQRKKFARGLPSAHVDSNCSSHCFALILDDLFAVS